MSMRQLVERSVHWPWRKITWFCLIPVTAIGMLAAIYTGARYFLADFVAGFVACAYWLAHLSSTSKPVSPSLLFTLGQMAFALLLLAANALVAFGLGTLFRRPGP